METIRHQAVSLHADIIGELDQKANLVLFRGVPFATLEKRWTHSQVRDTLESPFDATRFGPRCPQAEGAVLVSGGVGDPVPGDDEFQCLNLNICTPKSALSASEKGSQASLPVMVWIHGGAFAHGANSVSRYRAQAFTANAGKVGTPVILVQINYRLGPLGFAASGDLSSETDEDSVSKRLTRTGNYGLVDQANALQWVNAHINDFGGDPSNVTVFGVSAGSASIHFHILTGQPLFDRAIMMSGAASSLGPLPMDLYEREWKKMARKGGIQDDVKPAERLSKLRDMDPQDIIKNYTNAAMGPVGDGDLLPETWEFKDRAPPSRCKEMILGDTNVEALILDAIPKNMPQEKFKQLIQSAFSPKDTDAVYENFGFTKEPQAFEAYRAAVRLILGSALFNYPNIGIADAALDSPDKANNVYLYHFEEVSPFPGPTQGLSYHGFCALLIYLNQVNDVPLHTQQTALEGARVFTAFAYGKEPWEAYGKSQRFFRMGPNGECGMHDHNTDRTREYKHIDWMKTHFDSVKAFVQGILFADGP